MKKRKNPLPPTQQNIRRWIYLNIHKYYPDLDRSEFVDIVKSYFGPLASDEEITNYRSLYNQIQHTKNLSELEKKNWWRYWMIENPIDFPKYDGTRESGREYTIFWRWILETMGDKRQSYLSDIKTKAQRKLEMRKNPMTPTPDNLRRWFLINYKKYEPLSLNRKILTTDINSYFNIEHFTLRQEHKFNDLINHLIRMWEIMIGKAFEWVSDGWNPKNLIFFRRKYENYLRSDIFGDDFPRGTF